MHVLSKTDSTTKLMNLLRELNLLRRKGEKEKKQQLRDSKENKYCLAEIILPKFNINILFIVEYPFNLSSNLYISNPYDALN